MHKEDAVHMYHGFLLSHKRNEIMPFAATSEDLEIFVLSEVSQRKRLYECISMWKKEKEKQDRNELAKQKQTHRRRKRIYGHQKANGGGIS